MFRSGDLLKLLSSCFSSLLSLSFILSFFLVKFFKYSFASPKGQYFFFRISLDSFSRRHNSLFLNVGWYHWHKGPNFFWILAITSTLKDFLLQVIIFSSCYFLHNFLVANLQMPDSEFLVRFAQNINFH